MVTDSAAFRRAVSAWLHSPAQEQDYLLATEALQGDSHAEDTLYLGSVSFVVNAARKYDVQKWFSPSDYPDIADEAFAKCYEHLERYQGLGRFRNWVLGYAKNIMRNRWRKQCTARRNQSLLESPRDLTAAPSGPTDSPRLAGAQPVFMGHILPPDRTGATNHIPVRFFAAHRPPARAFQLTCKHVLQHYEDARGNIPLELPASVPIGRALFRTQKPCYFIILQEKCQLCFPERRRIIISVA